MENKKTKLTISGNLKKSFKNFESSNNQRKKTVLIDKNLKKPGGKGTGTNYKTSSSNFKKNLFPKSKFPSKFPPSTISDFEKRKLAEQRATKRLKDDSITKDKKIKLGTKKRDVKLTVSRALSDEIEARERSLASVKRAREKENKNQNKDQSNESLKPVKRDINIPEAITVRELARIQTFSDSFIFKGSTISQQQQIGNAVPPLMARAIARTLKSMMNNVFKKAS